MKSPVFKYAASKKDSVILTLHCFLTLLVNIPAAAARVDARRFQWSCSAAPGRRGGLQCPPPSALWEEVD